MIQEHYRTASEKVFSVFKSFTPYFEKASIDEAYLDVTEEINKRLELLVESSFSLESLHLMIKGPMEGLSLVGILKGELDIKKDLDKKISEKITILARSLL